MTTTHSPARAASRHRRHATGVLVLVALGLLANCGDSPNSPTAKPRMVSGHVYQLGTAEVGEPMRAGVLITIEQADGQRATVRTNARGFYAVWATAGVVSISATMPGFQANRTEFDLADDTVLNFSLTPTPMLSSDMNTAPRSSSARRSVDSR